MNPIVEFRVSNLANGSQAAKEILEKDDDLDVIEYGCLSYCGQCARGQFALVNGDVVKGQTSEELVENVYKYFEENPMF